ncbi:MAG: discoidin domain-containing protein [Pirellulaceae bacterium]
MATLVASLSFVILLGKGTIAEDAKPKPLRALLIAGGCCHDYARQQEAIRNGIQSRANVRVDVYWTDNTTTAPIFPLYSKLNWAEEYDVIIHDECAADIKDEALVNRIVQIHQKLPAVHLHCAMHSFRTGNDAWFKHLGLQSSGHGPQQPIEITYVDSRHPITATLENWTTINEELYNNVKLFDAHPLAVGKQKIGGGKPRIDEAVVAWTNESQGARSFSTTIGHNTETVQDPRYLELIARGLLWACGKLTDEYLQPYSGDNTTTFIDKNKHKTPAAIDLGQRPKDATLVKIVASSIQSGHPPHHAIDADRATRWCADGGSYPQWLQFEFEKAMPVSRFEIVWEMDHWYRYVVEGSVDGEAWSMLLDRSNNDEKLPGEQALNDAAPVKFVRITGLSAGGWCSIREVKLKGNNIGTLWPADPDVKTGAFVPLQADLYASRGNPPPRIEKPTDQEEAAILKDVQVPEGFEATLFAAPPAVNYPVFVAATVDGTLFVSSDGNGSLGRDPQRGRVIRLRDLDGDGRADETKVFCEVDSPRGLVWDRDRLYLMHPPNLSVFFDHDDDGVADEQKTLVKNLAFGYDKRPADHTTNGVSIGVDGWLYIAGGDFGFINAEGTDGRKLTHRGGGVIRVRPDGSGLEIYSTGTRNILEVAISPQMDLFARDNTNDGGGWDVRLHHFTGNDDHGYPRLYKNFPSECVPPLADYGGGSGCGAVFIDEPGFGRWNNAPFTADWGTGSLFRHSVKSKDATFQETSPPESFIKMTRPTDADVDGNSRVYASWARGDIQLGWADVGYIVCVKPKDFQPSAMPDFSNAADDELVEVLNSESYRRRMEAQRELLRRAHRACWKLLDRARDNRSADRNLLEDLQTDDRGTSIARCLNALDHNDALMVHTAIRCLARNGAVDECLKALDAHAAPSNILLRALAMMHTREVVDGLISRLETAGQPLRRDILAALCRLHFTEGEWKGDSWGTRPDTRGPYYQPASWSETEKIASVLRQSLDHAEGEEAAELLQLMHRNRIELDDANERMLRLAETDERLLGTAVSKLALSNEVPDRAIGVLRQVVENPASTAVTLCDAVVALTKMRTAESTRILMVSLSRLDSLGEASHTKKASVAMANAPRLDSRIAELVQLAASVGDQQGLWVDAAIIHVASREDASPEARANAAMAIETAWPVSSRRGRLMRAAAKIENHFLDDRIWNARRDQDAEIAKVADAVIKQLKIEPTAPDTTPKIESLNLADAVAAITQAKGNVAVGQRVFAKANCVACHTLSKQETQKGPFLGNIAKTYKRGELVAAVLEPNKTIAQGFATNSILTVDGTLLNGFVTNEQSDRVTIRDHQAKEHTILKDDIEVRKTLAASVMPTGLMNQYTTHEVASLIDYLQSLAN